MRADAPRGRAARWPVRGLCALALGFGPALPAAAQPVPPGREGELARLVPPEPGARACYERRYDADHLEAHPRQRVTEIGFMEGRRIRMSRGCDFESGTLDLTPGRDDHRFHLTREASCPPYERW